MYATLEDGSVANRWWMDTLYETPGMSQAMYDIAQEVKSLGFNDTELCILPIFHLTKSGKPLTPRLFI